MLIQGFKGKGGGRTPVEEKDSLRSVQYAEVIDLVSEGEVQGLVNGAQSVYLDKVPLQNADSTFNFEGVTFAYKVGTQGQSALPGFNEVASEVGVGVLVEQATPVVRSITNAALDIVRVTIGVPQLSLTNTTNGDVGGSEFEFAIDIQANGGGYVEKYRNTIRGKTMSRYQRSIRLELTGSAPWDVRVRRISAPAAGSHVQNAFYWDSYTEVQSLRLRYPNSAVHGLRVSAQQFSRVPVRAYDMLGILCRVPSNYDPIARTYTGVWDGTFHVAWTNNPAWVMYDLITTARYGLGDLVDPALVDKWNLYTIGKYCDVAVPDGGGGYEPRFTCNLVLQTRAEAQRVVQDLAAVFRGISFWSAAAVQFAQDAPGDVKMNFSPANVKGGLFNYQGTSAKQRHSMAIVYWNNPADFFARVPEVVMDDDLVAKLGLRELELSPLGCTSRGQAARVGRWALYSEDTESETVMFTAALEGAGLRLGQVFDIADPSEAGERLGGRIHAATDSAVTLDAPVTLAVGEAYTLRCMWPDTAEVLGYRTEERAVTNGAGVASVINVAPPFSLAAIPGTVWVLASDAIQPTLWRCINIKEVDPHEYEVIGVAHNPGKYDLIENGMVLQPRPVSRLTDKALKPTDLAFNEVLYVDRSTFKSRLTVSFKPSTAAGAAGQRYRVSWRYNSGPWTQLPETPDQTVDISGLEPGQVDVAVRGVNSLGNQSLPLEGVAYLLGKTAPPSDMSSLALALSTNGVLASWDEPPDVDWQSSELSRSATFVPAQQITLKRSTTHLLGWLAVGTTTIYGRHWDEASSSVTAASASITILAPAAPALSRAEVQENSVVLRWGDAKTSQPIKRFIYRVGGTSDTYNTASDFGGAGGDQRSDILSFNTPGVKRIFLAAEDVGGNVGAAAFVDVTVVLPSNFTLSNQFTSTFSGTLTNANLLGDGSMLMLVAADTWATHFSTHGWADTSAQVAAGSPLFFQPGTTTAQYVEDFDLGVVLGSSTLAFVAQYAWLSGGGTVTPKISFKEHVGDPWTDVPNTWSAVATTFRYFRITIDVAATGADDLLSVTSLRCDVSLRELVEYASMTSLAADAAGTVYSTTKGFLDLKSAVFSPASDLVYRHSVVMDDSVIPPVVRVKCWDASAARINSAGQLVIGGTA